MQLLIKSNFSVLERALLALARDQVPYAAARALTDTARDCQREVTAALPTIFDRPTPFTARSIGITPARKETGTAEVFVKDIQAQYLLPEEIGGARTPAKAQALVLPGHQLELDRFGNIPPATVARLKREINKAAGRRQVAAGRTGRGKAAGKRRAAGRRDGGVFYVPKAGKGALVGGFYRRLPGHKLRLLIDFAASTHYQPRFGFQARVERVARGVFSAHMMKRLREAIATSR